MDFYVMTLFPELIEQAADVSILGRARRSGIISVQAVNIRDYSGNKHNRVDDYPYGGGAGMVMAAEPVVRCYEAVRKQLEAKRGAAYSEYGKRPRVIYLSPQGTTLTQTMAQELSEERELILLCGHYEGIDERALELVVTDQISIGDYILTGGELPALVLIDAVARLVSGVLNNENSAETESFHDNLLEYPQYTRPEEFEGKRVPEILLSGHHAKIEAWRREQSILRTVKQRPDLMEQAVLNKKEQALYQSLLKENKKDEK